MIHLVAMEDLTSHSNLEAVTYVVAAVESELVQV